MLATAAVLIEEVALTSGFANVDTFNRAYCRRSRLRPEAAPACNAAGFAAENQAVVETWRQTSSSSPWP